MNRKKEEKAEARFAAYVAGLSGVLGAGGTFGLAALPVELPVSTTIMLRSIADIARSEGEDLSDPETALACVESSHWAGGLDRPTHRRADTSLFEVCSPRR
jgi:EcsC protein family